MLRRLHNAIDNEKATEEWRFDFQRVGDSVAIFRWDKNYKEYCTDFRQDFEKKFLKHKHEDLTSVYSYKLGPLNILQPAQVDCVETENEVGLREFKIYSDNFKKSKHRFKKYQ